MEIEWTERDPDTRDKRTVRAERFARKWGFKVQTRRYEPWVPVPQPSRDMWETLLDALERRYPRREGVTDEDLKQVRAIVAALPAEETDSPDE
ncbi:hypothetical protein GobsT_45920 [Gemmata obscuriglobus]|uniref:Uncharacterized protein n=1 Tax=Gemmata obscuriglobus TaxID=114 RepID=A0A2Z3GUL3_9BACT|nr:hypothetical protein [Gemmata obscuriglobus]AWM37443.1 hypothetical protein C1280_10735 [Gemmata obscuriglobus]QEG29794.1 hypothetical protein GobsT_45920 [Gemmata obscuriglobus]VTS09111.1 unnamed protein product [Gemmata obscuriglobus UQM 2246]